MARPKRTDRPQEKNISLPSSLVARVDLELFSELEGRVPFGAWQGYVKGLIEADLQERAHHWSGDRAAKAAPSPLQLGDG